MASNRVAIIGSGMAGVSSAYHLAVKHGLRNITLIDERAPVSFTSSLSLECYRDYFPQASMRSFLQRSIQGIETLGKETNNAFGMSRNGYAFFSPNPNYARSFIKRTTGREDGSPHYEVRYHNPASTKIKEEYLPLPGKLDFNNDEYKKCHGVDIVESAKQINELFPYVTSEAKSLLHARRCGWVSAQTLGMVLFEKAREAGVQFISGKATGIRTNGDQKTPKVTGVEVALNNSSNKKIVDCDILVNASGPFTNETQRMISKEFEKYVKPKGWKGSVQFPLKCELQAKVIFRDRLGVVPRNSPILIWSEEIELPFTDEERAVLEETLTESQKKRVFGKLPAGLHFRPYAHDSLVLVWEYFHLHEIPTDPPNPDDLTSKLDEMYIDVAIRGASKFIPGFAQYLENMPKASIDAGFYCLTPENLPIIGPWTFAKEAQGRSAKDHSGVFICAGLSHYGIMSSMAHGDLLAHHVISHLDGKNSVSDLPAFTTDYAKVMLPDRYLDEAYVQTLESGHGGKGSIG